MGRHSLPDEYGTDAVGPRPRTRGRTVAIATALVLVVAGGTALAARSGLLSFGGACDGKTVHLDIAASPDVAPALRDAADLARKKHLTSDGQCLDTRVQAGDSYKIADSLRKGGKGAGDYEAWVPDSSLWIQRAGLGGNATPVTAMGNIASSPIGISMVPSAAKSMGWPAKHYTWAQLTGAAMEGDKLRLGTADPARSATGLLALTQLGASTKKSGSEGDTQAAAMAKALSQRTTDSDGRLTDTLARDSSGTEQGNPRRNQALFLSEQSSFRYNATAGDKDGLDLFYPKDGSPQLDFPFALVDEGDKSTDERRAAIRFMTLLGEDAGIRILDRHGFRTDDEEPSDAVVAGAGGRSPQPYATSDSEPPTDKELQETLGVWTITVQSARITVVVDASASMANYVPGRNQSRMEVTKASMLQALATFTPEDEIGLWEFATLLDGNRDYRKLVPTERLGDRKGGGTQRDRLSEAFSGLQPVPGGATGLYDTTLAAYEEATSSYRSGKFNALVVVTDGANQDLGSISRSHLVSRLQSLADPQHPVPLIAIAVGPDADKDEVEQIAGATGGSGHQVSDPAQIHAVILKAIVEAGAKG
ncbi:substrate-binding and VWA domain-containing protein [Streptomyces sp. NBC_01445]|uniref:substrate-binding and VWA domain-containing protein n=1 Tax=Streptomyces sp. NBC_01445 TaxID=2903869 RepID=UPI002DDBA24C|nr:substrate-binding and VWA domain-containing protein [Streptomyces sp. NBC_01445]WSE08556.1 substrate-binding and VWA domain-containing protein [Streptomyces sp. NBC_01445]